MCVAARVSFERCTDFFSLSRDSETNLGRCCSPHLAGLLLDENEIRVLRPHFERLVQLGVDLVLRQISRILADLVGQFLHAPPRACDDELKRWISLENSVFKGEIVIIDKFLMNSDLIQNEGRNEVTFDHTNFYKQRLGGLSATSFYVTSAVSFISCATILLLNVHKSR